MARGKIDLLQGKYEDIPQNIRTIIETFDDNKDGYKECARLVDECKKEGYHLDYGLDADVYDLWKE